MPSKEHDWGGPPSEQTPDREREQAPYVRAAHFQQEPPARRAYAQVQAAVLGGRCDLSTFRFQVPDETPIGHYVAVVGSPPPPALSTTLSQLLAGGEPTELSPVILGLLLQRRAQARLLAPWTERHGHAEGGGRP